MMEELLKPVFTPFFVLLTCMVFAWIGFKMEDDNDDTGSI